MNKFRIFLIIGVIVWGLLSGAQARAGSVMSVESCIDYALTHSPELKKLGIDYEDERLDTLMERAAFACNLQYDGDWSARRDNLGSRLSVSKEFMRGFDVTTEFNSHTAADSDEDSSGFSVTLSKMILGGGTLRETAQALNDAIIDEAAAMNRINRKKREIAYRVQKRYHEVIGDLHYVDILRQKRSVAERNLEHAELREDPLDIATAKIQIPETELDIIQAERDIKNNIDQLKILMGMPVDSSLQLDQNFTFRRVEYDLEKDLRFALENDEEFINHRLELKKLERAAEIARIRLAPEITLSAAHETAYSELESDTNHDQRVSLHFAWEIGGNTDRSENLKARNRIRKHDVDYFMLEQNKRYRLNDLDRMIRNKDASIRLQEQRNTLVARQVELYRDRWENGETSIIELIRSQNQLEESRARLIRLQMEYMSLLAEYRFETGK